MASILLVDASADTLEMYSLALRAAGYSPLTASNGTDALDQLKHQHLDVVVTEIQLDDGRGGWDLITEIKKDPSTRAIPVVVLTGRAEPSLLMTAKRVGCAAVLMKPCLPDALALVLRQVLRRVA